MNVFYQLQGVEFEWDSDKSDLNFEKHGVKFEEAAEVFFDPFYQLGDATVNKERRSFVLGYSLSERILWVVYVERGVRTRIISARPASRTERKIYENA